MLLIVLKKNICSWKSRMLVATENYISILSRRGLTHPCKIFLDAAKIIEQEFKKFHQKSLNPEKYIFNKLTELVEKRLKNIPHKEFCFVWLGPEPTLD